MRVCRPTIVIECCCRLIHCNIRSTEQRKLTREGGGKQLQLFPFQTFSQTVFTDYYFRSILQCTIDGGTFYFNSYIGTYIKLQYHEGVYKERKFLVYI